MSKSLGAFDAGIITYNDPDFATRLEPYLAPDNDTVEALRNGRTPCLMDSIQACFLRPKLRILDELNGRKREIASIYDSIIDAGKYQKPVLRDGSEGVFRDYFVMTENREAIMRQLLAQGIETKSRYTTPIPLLKTFAHLERTAAEFPTAVRAAQEVICLPTHLNLSNEDIRRVAHSLNSIK